ncbi:MAG: glycosyltransferase family 4 protein, partial [Oscillochloris sp.]|nr:glycosyltransferase family 4 protein [Oscillochloris sp.]
SVDEETRHDLFARCRAFIFPGEEDFGITPLEAMAAGRPVIAYGAGGALDTVVDGVTGRFFYEPTAAALAAAVAASHNDTYDPAAIRQYAEGFGLDLFLARMRGLIDQTVAAKMMH